MKRGRRNSREKAQKAQKREEKTYPGDTEFGLKEKVFWRLIPLGLYLPPERPLCLGFELFSSFFTLFAAIPFAALREIFVLSPLAIRNQPFVICHLQPVIWHRC